MVCGVADRHRGLCISVNRYLNARMHETIGAGSIKDSESPSKIRGRKFIPFVIKGTKRETLFRLANTMADANLLVRLQGNGGTGWKNT